MRPAVAPLLALASLACSGRPGATTADSAATPAPNPPAVTLERAPCFGTCPVYQVSIWRNGTVRFVGRRHVAYAGEVTESIPPARVDSLVAELKAGGYFDFADKYLFDEPACGQYATDSPVVVTSLSVDGRTKEIRHDYGCRAAPRELGRLEQRIDEVAGSKRWIEP
jgi:hypothetical protein